MGRGEYRHLWLAAQKLKRSDPIRKTIEKASYRSMRIFIELVKLRARLDKKRKLV